MTPALPPVNVPPGRRDNGSWLGTASKLARIVYHLMRYGEAYVQQQEAAYAEQVRARQEKQLLRRAKELGFEMKRIEPASTEAAAKA